MMSSPRRGCFGASSVGEIRNGKVGNNKRNSRVSFCPFLKEKVPMIQSARVVLRLARFPAGTCRTFKSSIYFKKSCVYSFLRWTAKIRFKGRAQYQGSCEIRRQQQSQSLIAEVVDVVVVVAVAIAIVLGAMVSPL